jgi:anaerobic ribonucleoside-triphosphate reductase
MSDDTKALEVQTQPALTDEERQPCEVWTRVMGYHRPVASFNAGKKGEFAERTCFTEDRAELN